MLFVVVALALFASVAAFSNPAVAGRGEFFTNHLNFWSYFYQISFYNIVSVAVRAVSKMSPVSLLNIRILFH